ncbi:hypothetical protein ACWDWV_34220, partial [Streptosporangium sandarakinum]
MAVQPAADAAADPVASGVPVAAPVASRGSAVRPAVCRVSAACPVVCRVSTVRPAQDATTSAAAAPSETTPSRGAILRVTTAGPPSVRERGGLRRGRRPPGAAGPRRARPPREGAGRGVRRGVGGP